MGLEDEEDEEDLDFDLVGLKIWTCMGRRFVRLVGLGGEVERAYVELPAFDVLACVFVRDDDDELGDLAADHPFI